MDIIYRAGIKEGIRRANVQADAPEKAQEETV
jgi:hypothetical protein